MNEISDVDDDRFQPEARASPPPMLSMGTTPARERAVREKGPHRLSPAKTLRSVGTVDTSCPWLTREPQQLRTALGLYLEE